MIESCLELLKVLKYTKNFELNNEFQSLKENLWLNILPAEEIILLKIIEILDQKRH